MPRSTILSSHYRRATIQTLDHVVYHFRWSEAARGIARALIRDPKVLLLDEATSSLDSESEKLVQSAFERASEGRTMLVVAHRLATVQDADVIFVLGDGQLLEQGCHAELLKRRGVYWNMCQSQSLDR